MLLTVQLEQWKPSYESQFNEDHHPGGPIKYNNCYTYALAAWLDPLDKTLHNNVLMPGIVSSKKIDDKTYEYEIYDASNADEILELIRDDLEHWGYSRNYIVECGETDMPPEGYYKIALRYGSVAGKGFHFLRQVSDRSGGWAHKNGEGAVRVDDENNQLIYNPKEAYIPEHNEWVCYYAVKSIDYDFD